MARPCAVAAAVAAVCLSPLTDLTANGQEDPLEAIHQLLDRMDQAWSKRDAEALKKEFSPDFVSVHSRPDSPDGAKVFNRDTVVEAIRMGMWESEKLESHQTVGRSIRVLGPDLAYLFLTMADRYPGRRSETWRTLQVAHRSATGWHICFGMPLCGEVAVYVRGVRPGSQAARLGLRVGDAVLRYAWQAARDSASVVVASRAHEKDAPGTKLPLLVRRGCELLSFDAVPGLLGLELEDRLLPGEGAIFVSAGTPHPVAQAAGAFSEVWRSGDEQAILRCYHPESFLAFEIKPDETMATELVTRAKLPELVRGFVARLQKEYDMKTLKSEATAMLLLPDVAVTSLKTSARKARGDGAEQTASGGLWVYARERGKWCAVAVLLGDVEIGPPEVETRKQPGRER